MHITFKAANKYTNVPIQQLTILINKEGGTKEGVCVQKVSSGMGTRSSKSVTRLQSLGCAHPELIFIWQCKKRERVYYNGCEMTVV